MSITSFLHTELLRVNKNLTCQTFTSEILHTQKNLDKSQV